MFLEILESYGWLIAFATIAVTVGAGIRARRSEAARTERAEWNLRSRDDRA